MVVVWISVFYMYLYTFDFFVCAFALHPSEKKLSVFALLGIPPFLPLCLKILWEFFHRQFEPGQTHLLLCIC